MLHRTLRLTMAVALFFMGAVACGSDVNSGVDKSKPANDLTPEEVMRVCTAVTEGLADATSAERRQDISCRVAGAINAGVVALTGQSEDIQRQACQERYDQCLQEPPPAANGWETFDCNTVASSQCNATVGEIEQCATDWIQAYKDFDESVARCDQVGSGTETPMLELPAQPSSCAPVAPCSATGTLAN